MGGMRFSKNKIKIISIVIGHFLILSSGLGVLLDIHFGDILKFESLFTSSSELIHTEFWKDDYIDYISLYSLCRLYILSIDGILICLQHTILRLTCLLRNVL